MALGSGWPCDYIQSYLPVTRLVDKSPGFFNTYFIICSFLYSVPQGTSYGITYLSLRTFQSIHRKGIRWRVLDLDRSFFLSFLFLITAYSWSPLVCSNLGMGSPPSPNSLPFIYAYLREDDKVDGLTFPLLGRSSFDDGSTTL